MNNLLIYILGFYATIIFGDSAVIDRWFWLKKNIKPGNFRTLDIGCGSGAFSLYAAKRGNEVIGISFDQENNQKAIQRAEILKIKKARFITENLGNLDKLSKDLGLFDQIICFETIEHILKDEKLLHDCSCLLKSGGQLLLTTPYLYYNARLLGDDKDGLSVCEDGGHVRWGYTHEQLERMLLEEGLEITKKDYITGFISQCIIRIIRVVGNITSPKIAWIVTFPLRFFIIFDRPVTALLRYPYLSVGINAKKV